jgi:signal transduction histidine kinase
MPNRRRPAYAGSVSRVYAWIQRHPKLIDAIPAVFLILIGLIGVGTTDHGYRGANVTALNRLLVIPLPILVAGPLIFRRRWPIGTFVFAAAFGVIAFFAGPLGFSEAVPAYLFLLYTVAAYRARRYSIPAMVVVFVGGMIQIGLRNAGGGPEFNWRNFLVGGILIGGLTGLFWVIGDSMKYRREYYVKLEDRAERLERERDAQAQIAAAAERARIARELHDVVAHNVSVMVVQADGASYALDDDPESARKALLAIAQTGRTALTEMRRMLGVLRSADDVGVYAPQPGIEQLGDLLEQVRAAGLAVTLTVEGVPREMPTGLALAVYRIVQESLTNTRKHGGPNAKATVALVYTEDSLVLRITDNGRGELAPGDGAGHGMVGMRERVNVFDGTLEAGPRPGGGYAVEAMLPFAALDAGPESEEDAAR